MTSWFVVVWVVIGGYVVVGNYLYFAKVLPVLRGAGLEHAAQVFPSAQAEQFRRAGRILRSRGDHVWFLPLLNRCRELTYAVIGLIAIIALWGTLS